MPGIIMGALGGMGEQAANVGSTLLKSELGRETRAADRQQDSDLTLQRAKALEEYKAAAIDRDRTAQVDRIDTAAGRLAEGEVAKKRGIIESNIADPTAWTPEQQAAVMTTLCLSSFDFHALEQRFGEITVTFRPGAGGQATLHRV